MTGPYSATKVEKKEWKDQIRLNNCLGSSLLKHQNRWIRSWSLHLTLSAITFIISVSLSYALFFWKILRCNRGEHNKKTERLIHKLLASRRRIIWTLKEISYPYTYLGDKQKCQTVLKSFQMDTTEKHDCQNE